MATEALFEFTCPECERGTVRTTRIHNYKTKIKGYPFTVDEALIGVCDECEAQSFAPEETKRWEECFSRSLRARHAFLTSEEIMQIRKALGISMENFARLIGSTRQSVSMWEKTSRTTPPVRTADLLMKLVRQSLTGEPVDVLPFLLDEARKWGVVIGIRRPQRQNEGTIFRRSSNPSTPWEQIERRIVKAFEEIRNEGEDETMNNMDLTAYLLKKSETARKKYEDKRLKYFRAVIAPKFWKKVQGIIKREAATTLSPKLPVLFFLFDRRDVEDLQPLDRLLGYLKESKEQRHRDGLRDLAKLLQNKKTDYRDYRHAAGAIFEIEILSRLLEKNENSFDPYPQGQNNNPDAKIILGEKPVYFEATIRSQSEEQERHLEIGHTSSPFVPGLSDLRGDARRITGKIKGKRGQQVAQAPNILCIGLPDFSPDPLILEWNVPSILKEEPQLTGILFFRWGQKSDFIPEKPFWNPSPCLESQLSATEQKTVLDWFGFDNSHVENEKSEKDEAKGRIAHIS